MPTERQSPDAILAITSLSPNTVGHLQDDPDSPDANWLVAANNNTNTDVRVSFGSPTGNPRVGADLQEFRALVRQFDEGQTGTPQARVELWENGSLVRAGSDTNVTAGGVVLSLTWNANEIGTADGSLVECNVVGTKSGGSPGARNSVDVGAVEWNVDYSAPANNYTISGAVTVTPSVAATLDYTRNASIAGDVTVTPSIAATLGYTLNAAIAGAVTVTPSIAATMQYTGSAPEIVGNVTVTPSIGAALAYNIHPALTGDCTATPSVAGAMDYTRNASIAGASTITADALAGMIFNLHAAFAGDVSLAVSVAASMQYAAAGGDGGHNRRLRVHTGMKGRP